MKTCNIEFHEHARERLALFIKNTAEGIEEGYGAGNCTPESVAFWTLHPNTDVSDGWCLLRIEIGGDDLTDHEIAAAVRKVGTEPEGKSWIFGRNVIRWSQLADIPIRKDGLECP